MGATVTTGKLAAAFKAAGQIIYVLFEETYDKRTYPQTPRWCCYYIGGLEGAIRSVFNFAHYCEGGMLQNRNGWITPEGYIAGWMAELKNPAVMPDMVIRLWHKAGDYNCSIPDKSKAIEALVNVGREDLVDMINAAKEPVIELFKDYEAVLALYGGEYFSPNRGIDAHFPDRNAWARDATLGYVPDKWNRKFELLHPECVSVDDNARLLKDDNGSWYSAGWDYSIVGSYICSLWESEMQEPGTYRARIKAYREAVRQATRRPGLRLRVNVDAMPADSTDKKDADFFIKHYQTTKTSNGFEVEINDLNAYCACGFTKEFQEWIVPEILQAQQPQLEIVIQA